MILSKSSQIKIQEMTFMLLFLVIFFIIVFLIYISVSMAGIRKDYYQGTKEGSILLLARIADSPELACGGSEGLCIDTDKLLALKNHSVYNRFWGVDGLVIKNIYPLNNKTIECSIGSYPNCNTFTIKKPSVNSVSSSSFVSLCRRDSYNGYGFLRCELGEIKIYTEKTA